jgi:hypothetical protein
MTTWRLLTASLVGVAVATVAGAGLAMLGGKLLTHTAWLALGLGALAAVLTARTARAPEQRVTPADTILFVVFALASLRAFLWVLYPRGGDLMVLSPHNLGDLALHLNLIQRWANSGYFWPENPFLAGAIFPYHAGMDLWNALLAKVGVPVVTGLRWTGLLAAAATAIAVWLWGRGFALAAVLFAGGLGALGLFAGHPPDGMEVDHAWKNVFLTMFVTQRGLLYSLPAGLVLMTVWRAQLEGNRAGPTLPVPAQVALYASLPFFNAPAFLFLSLLLAACAAVGWIHGRLRPFLSVGLLSIIPASWLVHLVTAGFSAPNTFRFAPGWLQENHGWWFWAENFGVFLPLATALGLVVWRRPATLSSRVFVSTGLVTLAFSFLFQLAPWAWDNTKLILWAYVAIIPFLWSDLLRRWPTWIRGLTCLALFASGALSLVAGLDTRHGYKLADRAELADTHQLLRRIQPDTRLATAPSYEHPALLLGQPVVMGHDGHLFSQGLDYAETQRQLDTLMSGSPGWKIAARHLRVHYLFWGRRERERWPASSQPWKDCARPLGSSGSNELYLITPCLLED